MEKAIIKLGKINNKSQKFHRHKRAISLKKHRHQ